MDIIKTGQRFTFKDSINNTVYEVVGIRRGVKGTIITIHIREIHTNSIYLISGEYFVRYMEPLTNTLIKYKKE